MARAKSMARGMEPVPGYRLSQFLGKGGWGSVWKAIRADGEACALKFIPCDSQLAAAQEIRGLQAIRQLQHPHLIRIEQVWSISGYIVIAMELAEGSLLDLLEVYYAEFNQPIVPEHVCFFLRQAAEALDFINARQHPVDGQRVAFRHCDVKPSNLLVEGNNVKLADFSLVAQSTSSMCYHRRVGTLTYSAPEILQGRLTDKTDQYSLALTYCHLRGGRLPFAEAPAHYTVDCFRAAPDLSMQSAAEQPIINRGLATVPQDRWNSCTEMIDHLRNCLAETNILA